MLFEENLRIQRNDAMLFHPHFNVIFMSYKFRGLLHSICLPYTSRDDE